MSLSTVGTVARSAAFFEVLPMAMAALRFPETCLAVALSAACDTVGATTAYAYVVEPERVTCLAESGIDARPVPASGRLADPIEAAMARAFVTATEPVFPGWFPVSDWSVCSGRPLEDDGYALVVFSGPGAGPEIDPSEIRDPLVLLITHRWFASRMKGMCQEMTALREDRAIVSAMLRHDLRHPIQAITAASDMLQSGDFDLDTGERDEFLTMISSEAQRLSRMIDEAFEDAVADDHVPPKLRTVEATDLVGRVVETIRRGRGGRLDFSVDPHPLRTDPDLLGRALLNLVDNAQKYAPEESGVQIRGTRRGSSYAISVVDAGNGVDADLVPYLFTPFSNDSRRCDSTGLGLVSVSRTMDRLGGRVTYSRVSGTTVFELIVPVE